MDTTVGSYVVTQVPSTGSWDDCFAACQANTVSGGQTCTGFTYGGGNNGIGQGSCFLKNAISSPSGTMSFKPASAPAANYVGAIMSRYYNAAGDTQSSSSSSMSSSSQSTSSVSTSSVSTSVSATPTVSPNQYTCPANDNQTVTDSNGVSYQLSCGYDTTGVSLHIALDIHIHLVYAMRVHCCFSFDAMAYASYGTLTHGTTGGIEPQSNPTLEEKTPDVWLYEHFVSHSLTLKHF